MAGLPWIFSFPGILEIASALSRQPATADSCRVFRVIERASKVIVPMEDPAAKAAEQACVWRAGRRLTGRFPRQ